MEDARTILELQVNKKMLQSQLKKTTRQIVFLKDLHNLGSSCKGKRSSGIEKTIKMLKQIADIGLVVSRTFERNFTREYEGRHRDP